jgi:ABC-type transporter Mla maintaining outer membrane lipid asymmetry permease subunit MlaE
MIDQILRALHEAIIPFFAFIEAVPPGIVRCHHGGAKASPASFMMPQLIIVEGFLIEKIQRILRRRQVTIYAVGNKALAIVHMSGCFPGVVSESNLMTGCTEFGSGGSHHGVISIAEKGECDENSG